MALTACVLSKQMTFLLVLLTLNLAITTIHPGIVEPGPNSGVVLKGQPGLLITNCRLHTQKVFVKLSPKEVCKKNLPTSAKEASFYTSRWSRVVAEHAEADISHVLRQLQKFTLTQSELGGTITDPSGSSEGCSLQLPPLEPFSV